MRIPASSSIRTVPRHHANVLCELNFCVILLCFIAAAVIPPTQCPHLHTSPLVLLPARAMIQTWAIMQLKALHTAGALHVLHRSNINGSASGILRSTELDDRERVQNSTRETPRTRLALTRSAFLAVAGSVTFRVADGSDGLDTKYEKTKSNQ